MKFVIFSNCIEGTEFALVQHWYTWRILCALRRKCYFLLLQTQFDKLRRLEYIVQLCIPKCNTFSRN